MVVSWVVVSCVAASCAPSGAPELTVSITPKRVTDATPAVVRVKATKADGTVGDGTVQISSEYGSLATPAQVTLDSYGTTTAELVCDPRAEPGCEDSMKVVAEWTSQSVRATAEALFNPPATGGGGDTGNPVNVASMFSSGHVLLLGTLAEGACGRDALADPRTPTRALVSFDCYASKSSAIVNQGSLYYSVGPGLRRFHADSWDSDLAGGSSYPNPEKNPDDKLYEECGDLNFKISPAGHILHTCPKKGEGLYLDGRPFSSAGWPLAIGDQDALLERTGVRTSDGTLHAWSMALDDSYYGFGPTLAVAGGFLLTHAGSTGCTLYRAELDGTLTRLGGYQASCGGKLDAAGTMTQESRGPGAFQDTIIEVPLNGTPTTIYDEANATAQDLSVFPPKVYVKIHISSLVSGN